MQFYLRGLAAALLCVVLLGTGGCSVREQVYYAGLEREIQTEESSQTTEHGTDPVQTEQMQTEQIQTESISTELTQTEPDGCIYVCGAVRQPGVYPVYEDMRVFEAIEAAGGFSEEADRQWLNLAEPVSDGQQLYIYTKEETLELKQELQQPAAQASSGRGTGQAADSGSGQNTDQNADQNQKVNLNTADRETLMTLPGIGEAKADAILHYREEHGGFGSIEEIQNISGIKSAVFSKIKDRITV